MTDQLLTQAFAICIANDGCDDLSAGMLYRVLPDEAGAEEGLIRVVDDSGEDYLYPRDRFVLIDASKADVPKLLAVVPAYVA
jgi:hypothetical protein